MPVFRSKVTYTFLNILYSMFHINLIEKEGANKFTRPGELHIYIYIYIYTIVAYKPYVLLNREYLKSLLPPEQQELKK